MDISDKNFKPCPCGYQICQFCYNNIRLNPELNGRCPGCRRLYDDESVEYKSISPEEYKLQQIRKEKREREKKQREKEKKETEMANKKHLAGLRVVQKNLVYVTGLNPPCASDELHSVLRSDKYFGQYGKILKIVINRKNPTSHHQNPGLVVYVTFARKEDALRCINELDGSLCDGRLLRAAHGTTKYCLSYLRGHPCPNPNCMFLHEPGEEADSYTRKDLSTQQGIKMGMMGMNKGDDNNEEKERMGYSHASSDRAASEARESPAPASAVPAPAAAPPVAIAPAPTQPPASAGALAAATVLPAAAGWAKAAASALASASGSDSGAVANASAFPTLGEIKEKQQKKDSKLKARPKKESLGEDYDWDDSPVAVGEDIAARLNLLETSIEKLKVHFAGLDSSAALPLFAFTPPSVGQLTLEDDKLAARHIIERYILKPIKNYHLAYQNHPVTQQQALLQQQAQMRQAQPQPTPTMQMAQVQLMEQKKLLEQQQAEQRLHHEQQRQQPLQTALLQQQQQQQYLLLQQLQHQQAQQQAQQHQGLQQHQLQQQQARGTSTPPPPGLFAEKQQQYNAQSSSSQLLTQLMSGKRPVQ